MLSNYAPVPTLATADIARARAFYEGLGFTGDDSNPGGVTFASGTGSFFVYESAFAGTNKATSMEFEVPAAEFDSVLAAIRGQGVSFDTFDFEGAVWDGDVLVMDSMRAVWFSDPDGNIISVGTRTT